MSLTKRRTVLVASLTLNNTGMNQKEMYAAPATEVLEMHLEGVIAASGVNSIRSGYGDAEDEDWD